MEFGYARSTDTALVKKYKVKSFPAFYMLKGADAPKLYDGEDFTYQHLFDFINVYSETFVFGGNQEVKESGATKAWLSERIPFMSKDSGNDVCFSKDGTLCVLYVTPCRHSVDQAVIDEMTTVKDEFVSKVTKGIQFTFAKLSAHNEPTFTDIFNLAEKPAFVIMNAGKRKRFVVHDGPLTAESL